MNLDRRSMIVCLWRHFLRIRSGSASARTCRRHQRARGVLNTLLQDPNPPRTPVVWNSSCLVCLKPSGRWRNLPRHHG